MSAARAAWPFVRESPSAIALRWLTIAVLAPYLLFGGFSSYRAWVQVRSLSLHARDAALRPGSTVAVEAESWARTIATVRLMLEQGARSETLLVHRLPINP